MACWMENSSVFLRHVFYCKNEGGRTQMIMEEVMELITGQVFGVWFLIGAALVFWMQAGFAMAEAGFTRIKNAGNIVMKNLMDFCIGTVMFILVGSSLLLGEDMLGIIGKPGFDLLTAYGEFDYSSFVFNLVFCATTATIVSGAMAERTKFSSYCIYSAVLSAVIYPIEAHWTWGGGFLANMGFHDYAGSCCIHMVGGICALVGAAFLGPRIGKYVKNEAGKIVKVNAIPGHNLVIAALGVFILWLGWYGFNGAAATDLATLGSIFLTTTVSPAVATVVCMIYTWVKYGKPDVSMCLNASLAGLVAITAPCDVTDCIGAAIIGAVAGLLVIFGIWFVDNKLYIDDPVGAVAVHGVNGVWGTLAVGLFATSSAPGFAVAEIQEGLFYGGGFNQLGLQAIGCGATAAWAFVAIAITFLAVKSTIGLRVTTEEEIVGLDAVEHGLSTAYGGFSFDSGMAGGAGIYSTPGNENFEEKAVDMASAIPVESLLAPSPEAPSDVKISKVEIMTNENKFSELKAAMAKIGVSGMTVHHVMGCGLQKGKKQYYRGAEVEMNLLPKIKVEIVVSKVPVDLVVDTARKALYTGKVGDGKIFVYNCENVIRIRTGDQGYDALQDDKE